MGLIDELGELTWSEIDERSTRLAHGLKELGVSEGDSVALLCRNHRYFLDASTALSKLGADILYLNTAFSAPQLGEVLRAREARGDHLRRRVHRADRQVRHRRAERVIAWHDGEAGRHPARRGPDQGGSTDKHPVPEHTTRPVILTSGTTGTPKGAPRGESGLDGAVALLSKMPFKTGGTTYIAAPLFHTWGWAHLNLAMLLGSTMVLRRKFDPADCLETVQEYDVDALIVIPVMMQRIMKLPEDKRSGDFSKLKVVAASGSALPGDLATEWMDAFGDNLYNTYGSTEVAWATIAQPKDMREAPGTAGKAPYNTVVKIYDDDGNPVEDGESGRIFVGNTMLFGGYTGDEAESKEMIDGLMSSGDIGRLDESGRLFVEGRDDEMIVSGGENVFPKEVEDCLARHENVDGRGGDRRRRRRLRQAAAGLRGQGRRRRRGRHSRRTSRTTWRATRCRARSSSSTSCPATRPARSSRRTSRSTTRTATPGEELVGLPTDGSTTVGRRAPRSRLQD